MIDPGVMKILIGHAALDPDFRDWLFTEPEEAAASIGVALPEAHADYIRNLDPELKAEVDRLADLFPNPLDDVAWVAPLLQYRKYYARQ